MGLEDLMWLVMLGIAITAVLLFPARRRDALRLDQPGTRDEQNRLLSSSARAADRIDRMRLELEEMQREVSARSDNKLQLLETLIRQADERIAVLREMQDGSDQREHG